LGECLDFGHLAVKRFLKTGQLVLVGDLLGDLEGARVDLAEGSLELCQPIAQINLDLGGFFHGDERRFLKVSRKGREWHRESPLTASRDPMPDHAYTIRPGNATTFLR